MSARRGEISSLDGGPAAPQQCAPCVSRHCLCMSRRARGNRRSGRVLLRGGSRGHRHPPVGVPCPARFETLSFLFRFLHFAFSHFRSAQKTFPSLPGCRGLRRAHLKKGCKPPQGVARRRLSAAMSDASSLVLKGLTKRRLLVRAQAPPGSQHCARNLRTATLARCTRRPCACCLCVRRSTLRRPRCGCVRAGGNAAQCASRE